MKTWPGYLWLLRSLARPGSVSRASLEAFRNQSLQRLISHAYRNVPYYRRLFDEHGIDPDGIRSVEDLEAVPISTREDLNRQDPRDLIATNVDPDGLIERETSGTTGHPVTVRKTWLETRLQLGFLYRANRSLGLRLRDKVAGIGLVGHRHPRDRKTLGNALSAFGILRSPRVDLTLEPRELLEEIGALRPDVVTGWASVIDNLAGLLLDGQGPQLRPRFLMTGREVLTQERRLRISEGFSAPVFDVYCCSEFHMIAWECKEVGSLHQCDDSMVIEVLDGARRVSHGEEGEIIGTSLHSFAMPFIRYRLGDVVTQGLGQCPCGAPHATLEGVLGRNNGYLKFPNGRTVHAAFLDRSILSGRRSWVTQYQFAQERVNHLVLRVIPSDPLESTWLLDLKGAVESLVGPEVKVEVLVVEDIPVPPGGRRETVFSNVS